MIKRLCTLLLLAACATAPAPAPKAKAPADPALFAEIVAMDKAMFDAFNAHDADKVEALFAPELEFFHDKGGLATREQAIGGMRSNFKRNDGLRRRLIPGSLEVYPIPGYGTLILADNGIETRLNQFLLSLDKVYTPESPWSLTVAYTYSDAGENRSNAAAADEHYLLDVQNLDNQPFIPSLGVPEHRLVISGYADVFWDMTLSGKLQFASPNPRDSVNCFDVTFPGNCYFDPFIPSDAIGYKQVDVALRKSFDTGTAFRPWIRVDVLNLFNWDNWADYNTYRGVPGDPNEDFGEVSGTNIVGPTRTFKLSLGFDF
jgi:hypothetical protein